MAMSRPGRPARGSRTGRPIMVVLDLLGRRWALRLGWELRHGPRGFLELQAACDGISPSVLSSRLREGVAAGILEREADGRYRLATDGAALGRILVELDSWSKRWAARRSGGPARPRAAGAATARRSSAASRRRS